MELTLKYGGSIKADVISADEGELLMYLTTMDAFNREAQALFTKPELKKFIENLLNSEFIIETVENERKQKEAPA